MYKFFKHANSDHAITVPKVIRGVPRYGAEIHSFDGYPENIPQHMFFDVQFKYIWLLKNLRFTRRVQRQCKHAMKIQ